MLTDTGIKKAQPRDKAYRLTDERGLHLLVQPNGSKLWQFRYRHAGKEKKASFGRYPDVSLKDARELRDTARKQVAQGLDPVAEKRAQRAAAETSASNSFEVVARQWWQQWHPARSERHAGYVLRRLEADVFPAIGARPVTDIQAPELVTMVKAIAKRGALDIAKRCYETTGQIFRYAIAHGLAERNPAADVKPADILPSRRKENYARVDARELPALLRKIEAYQGTPVTRLAMKLMALTFVRTSELIGARWDEFDLEAARWDIPAERMKMKTPHIVPLSTQAIEVLRTLHTVTGHRELLFPGERAPRKPMSNNTILMALDRMGYKGVMTGHGFRGIASTVLHEQGFDHAHIELQLASPRPTQRSLCGLQPRDLSTPADADDAMVGRLSGTRDEGQRGADQGGGMSTNQSIPIVSEVWQWRGIVGMVAELQREAGMSRDQALTESARIIGLPKVPTWEQVEAVVKHFKLTQPAKRAPGAPSQAFTKLRDAVALHELLMQQGLSGRAAAEAVRSLMGASRSSLDNECYRREVRAALRDNEGMDFATATLARYWPEFESRLGGLEPKARSAVGMLFAKMRSAARWRHLDKGRLS